MHHKKPMTAREALRKCQYALELETTPMTPFGRLSQVNAEALMLATTALSKSIIEEDQKPLTLQELKELSGPFWICFLKGKRQCPIPAIKGNLDTEEILIWEVGEAGHLHYANYGEEWIAYQYPPVTV